MVLHRLDYLECSREGYSGSAMLGSEDGITNAQTKVLEAADKVTSRKDIAA